MMTGHSNSDCAQFRSRECCIACGSKELVTLDEGKYSQEPLRGFIEQDPWGVCPLPFLGDHPWEFLQCRQCGQMFHRWLLTAQWQEINFTQWMSEEAIREFDRRKGKDTFGSRFQRSAGIAQEILRIERMTRSIRGDSAVRVLDFGCGWGDFLVMSAQFGFQAYGIDRDPDRQRLLRSRGVTLFPDIDTARATVGQEFHAVTLHQVLEHIEEPLELLIALRGVMAPGALLVLEVPNCQGISGIKTRSDYDIIHPLQHINCFTPQSLAMIAQRAGFKAERQTTAHVTADPLKLVKGQVRHWLDKFRSPGTSQCFRRI